MTPAEEGRRLLAEWKGQHRHGSGMVSFGEDGFQGAVAMCVCGEQWPCPTARLIAAVEEALDGPSINRNIRDREAMILAKLTGGTDAERYS